MAAKKRVTHQSSAPQTTGPRAGRPIIPPEYGAPQGTAGLLPWAYVSERMVQAKCYWICTVDAQSHPHATPVDGLWRDDRLYFGGSPAARRNRNLEANPAACIHLENGAAVVILHGDALPLRTPESELAAWLSEAAQKKYGYSGYSAKPEDYAVGGMYVFVPKIVMAWKQFPKDVTRWQL